MIIMPETSHTTSEKVNREVKSTARRAWYTDASQRIAVRRFINRLDRMGQNLIARQKAAASPAIELIPAPRPNTGTVWVHIDPAPPGEYLLKVLNSSNQIVYLEVLDLNGIPFSKTLRLKHLPSGVYPVLITNNKGFGSKPKQLVVER